MPIMILFCQFDGSDWIKMSTDHDWLPVFWLVGEDCKLLRYMQPWAGNDSYIKRGS